MNRDEVWLTSKKPDASTELKPLSDYRGHRVRRSANLGPAYLEGRFGGTPVWTRPVFVRRLPSSRAIENGRPLPRPLGRTFSGRPNLTLSTGPACQCVSDLNPHHPPSPHSLR